MAVFLYNVSLRIIDLLTRFVGIFDNKAKSFIQGRKTVWNSLSQQLAEIKAPILWVHCSSVGEYEQGRPVIEAFKHQYPKYHVLVTFYSPSGYNAVSRDDVITYKAYLPIDSAKNAKIFIELVKPKIAFFIKYEFWHYYLSELKKRNIPVFSVSAIFRPSQIYFKWYGSFNRKILEKFSYFFVQDKTSQQLLKTISLSSTITGDTRLDRVLKIREQKKALPEIDAFATSKDLMVIGSLRKEDIDIVIKFVQQHLEMKFIIAPHEINESMMQPLEKNISSTIRHSNLADSTNNQQVLIVDNMGMLSQLYRYASYAYIGGGFSDGLHNILEAAVYEIPVFFGNKDYQRFKEAIDLIDLGTAFPIGSYPEFAAVFNDISGNIGRIAEIKEILAAYLTANNGASEKIISQLETYMHE